MDGQYAYGNSICKSCPEGASCFNGLITPISGCFFLIYIIKIKNRFLEIFKFK